MKRSQELARFKNEKVLRFMSQDLASSFVGMLLADVAIALQRYRQLSSQAEMRNLVRTSFAAAEGLVWAFREHIVDVAASTCGLDLDEQRASAETSYSLTARRQK